MSNDSDPLTVELLSRLIQFPTVSRDIEAANSCFDYLETYLSENNLHVQRITSSGFPSIVATTQATDSPKVLLQAHIDVVPANPDYFELTQDDGKLYGRGVFDMKFAAACYLQLVRELKSDLHNYDFGIMFTSDEEIGGKNGVSYLLDNGYGAEVCILPDGGNDWQIEATCNSLWIVRISSTGQSAHGSRPWEGRNAINGILEGFREIEEVFGELKPYKNSLTISSIQGGSAVNQVPDRAEVVLDMRFINSQEDAKYKEIITKIITAQGLKIETIAAVAARSVDISHPHVASFLEIAAEVTGNPVTKTHSFGTSDACYFADHGIPTIVIRPAGGGAHSAHEWIDKAGVLQFYEVIKQYVTQTTKIQS